MLLKNYIFIAFCIFPVFTLFAIEETKNLDTDIRYQIYHDITDKNNPKLSITCSFNPKIIKIKHSKKEKIHYFYLELPQKWSTATDLEKYIQNLRFLDNQSKIVDLSDKTTKQIIIDPAQKWITFRYDVYPKNKIEMLEPIINQDVFHFIGHTILVYPQMDFNKPVNLILETKSSLLDKVTFANSFGIGPVQKLNIQLKETGDAAYAGGKYQLDKLVTDNTSIVSYGLKNETKKYVVDILNKIIPAQKSFWDETNDKPRFIFIYANDLVQTDMGGTHITNAISLILNEKAAYLKEDLPEFLAHEHWHNWMGTKFYSADGYKEMAWLFEGITDYYGHKTAYKTGLIDLHSWLEKYNRILEKHYLSPVKNKSNQHIARYFDEDSQYAKLPYYRGEVIAMELDHRIQKLSQGKYSLDNVIKDMFSDDNKHEYAQKDFLKALQKYYPDAKNFVKKYITQGEDLSLSASIFENKTKLHWSNRRPENYGLDLPSTLINKEISGLSDKTEAYKNGLRNGQRVLSYTVNYQDINKSITMKIMLEDEIEQDIVLQRIGKNLPVPQYRLLS